MYVWCTVGMIHVVRGSILSEGSDDACANLLVRPQLHSIFCSQLTVCKIPLQAMLLHTPEPSETFLNACHSYDVHNSHITEVTFVSCSPIRSLTSFLTVNSHSLLISFCLYLILHTSKLQNIC